MPDTTADDRFVPSCSCGWVGRTRTDRAAAERTAERHTWRDCPDSSQRVYVEQTTIAVLRGRAAREGWRLS